MTAMSLIMMISCGLETIICMLMNKIALARPGKRLQVGLVLDFAKRLLRLNYNTKLVVSTI